MSLTSAEFEKLMDFATYINKDYVSFTRNVSYGLELFFGFPLSVYTVFDCDYRGKVFIDYLEGHTVYPEGLRQYKDHLWYQDLFVQRVTGIRQGVMQSPVITITDIATYEEFYATEYGQYLKRINTPYQAILRSMYGRLYPLHVLSVFKTTEQGEFTEHELELLAAIDRVFSESVDRYLEYISHRFFWSFLEEETQLQDQNLAIVSGRGDIIFYNQEFVRLTAECFGERSESVLRYIRDELREQTGIELFRLPTPCSIDVGDFTFQFSAHSYPWVSREREFFFIRVDRKDKAVEPVEPGSQIAKIEERGAIRLVDAFGLTHREAEIAEKLAQGMSNGQLAEYFHISMPTVKFHLQNIRHKMNVSSRAEMIALVLENRS